MDRRSFIKKGFIGTTVFQAYPVFGLALSKSSEPSAEFVFLDENSIEFFEAITPIILGKNPETKKWPSKEIVSEVIVGIDLTIANLSAATQKDLRTLFNLLSYKPIRFVCTGVWSDWNKADKDSLSAAAKSWSDSSILIWKSAFDGIRKVVLSSWYANPISWSAIDYPGPPKFQ